MCFVCRSRARLTAGSYSRGSEWGRESGKGKGEKGVAKKTRSCLYRGRGCEDEDEGRVRGDDESEEVREGE